MNKLGSVVILSLLFLFVSLIVVEEIHAQSCGGTFACGDNVGSCKAPGGGPCPDNDCSLGNANNCSIQYTCEEPIGGFLDRSCSGSGGITACGAYGCGVGGCVLYDGCSSGSGGCQFNSQCGANQECCAGSPNNYCTSTCYACNGAYICAAPTATPTPAPSCTYGSCSTAGATAGSADPSGYYLCDGTCWQWVNNAATPTPTTPSSGGGGPAPTTPPTSAPTPDPGACSPCSAGVCCGGTTCDIGPPASCVGGPSFPPACTNNGGACTNTTTLFCDPFWPFTCSNVTTNNCCTGYCSGGTCANTPTCSGCQVWNGAFCEDRNNLCPAGNVCSGGVCTLLVYSISGNIYVDTDRDGIKDAGESGLANATSLGASIRISPGTTTTINGTTGNYTFSNLVNGSYSITLTAPNGYTITSTNPRNVNVSGSNVANINFGVIALPPVCVPAAISPNSTTVQPGSSVTLSVTNCTDKDPTTPDPPPPDTDWDPDKPPGGGTAPNNPACSDSRDNDADALIDTNDPGCHTDGNPSNPGSYDPLDDSETNTGGPNPQCSDLVDNDGDGVADANDPGCHNDTGKDSDGDGTPDSSDPDDDGDGTPDTSDPDDDGDGINDGSDPDWTGTYNPDDDSEQDSSNTRYDSSIPNYTDTDTSSTATWTAPNCPTSQLTVNPAVTINGPGGQTTYTSTITVPATYRITTNVRSVSDLAAPCTPASGTVYTTGGATPTGASVNVTGGTKNITQTTSTTTGSTSFSCLPTATYVTSINVPAGYDITGRTVSPGPGGNSGANGVSVNNINQNQTVTFCIAPTDPWFQTDLGNVRFTSISNPIPINKYGSIGENSQTPQSSAFPGIYYSSDNQAVFGTGSLSSKNWIINDEYSYNADTKNRNGGMSYDFYKAKARQDGVAVRSLGSGGILDWSLINPANPNSINGGGSGVYEVVGDLNISSSPPAEIFNAVNRSRVVILVSGDVTIGSEITIPTGQGLLIVASKRNMTISSSVGTATLTSTTSNLDGYYSAQEDIIIEGTGCSTGSNPDERLNVGGALIANSLKPFNINGTGLISNQRSLCLQNLNYPSLYVSSRPDFLTKFTDFYKTSYTKWQEVNP